LEKAVQERASACAEVAALTTQVNELHRSIEKTRTAHEEQVVSMQERLDKGSREVERAAFRTKEIEELSTQFTAVNSQVETLNPKP
jgi:predicted  nucleic acid-binding Zn-ribbon protein